MTANCDKSTRAKGRRTFRVRKKPSRETDGDREWCPKGSLRFVLSAGGVDLEVYNYAVDRQDDEGEDLWGGTIRASLCPNLPKYSRGHPLATPVYYWALGVWPFFAERKDAQEHIVNTAKGLVSLADARWIECPGWCQKQSKSHRLVLRLPSAGSPSSICIDLYNLDRLDALLANGALKRNFSPSDVEAMCDKIIEACNGF